VVSTMSDSATGHAGHLTKVYSAWQVHSVNNLFSKEVSDCVQTNQSQLPLASGPVYVETLVSRGRTSPSRAIAISGLRHIIIAPSAPIVVMTKRAFPREISSAIPSSVVALH
jgi:hypothetical protein